MLEDVTQRLASLGYTVAESDSWLLSFVIEQTENYIKNNCNVDVVPDGLHNVAVDMATGEFLLAKHSAGQLLSALNLETAVSQITEGDTTVRFAVGEDTPEKKLEILIQHLRLNGRESFATYRSLKW